MACCYLPTKWLLLQAPHQAEPGWARTPSEESKQAWPSPPNAGLDHFRKAEWLHPVGKHSLASGFALDGVRVNVTGVLVICLVPKARAAH